MDDFLSGEASDKDKKKVGDCMKKTGICPKCGGDSIGFIPVGKGTTSLSHGRYITINSLMLVKRFEIERYFCADCGFTEEYIADKDLKKLSNAAEER